MATGTGFCLLLHVLVAMGARTALTDRRAQERHE
ncbi:MAG: hypothetical protein JWO37_2903 [Acidimicrobiales bacterium]|jgi:hypothetical protein|nr:hypothetical protein [Acidimicrobiales bacterium]